MEETKLTISVRPETVENEELLRSAAIKTRRKLGPYVLHAALEYTREHYREIFGVDRPKG